MDGLKDPTNDLLQMYKSQCKLKVLCGIGHFWRSQIVLFFLIFCAFFLLMEYLHLYRRGQNIMSGPEDNAKINTVMRTDLWETLKRLNLM